MPVPAQLVLNMQWFSLIVFCVATVAVQGKSNATDTLYRELLDKTNDFVTKYNHTLDSFDRRAVPTKELLELEKLASYYQGKWKSELDTKPLFVYVKESLTNFLKWCRESVKNVITEYYRKDNPDAERAKQLKFCEGVAKWVKQTDSALIVPLKFIDSELTKLSTNLSKLPSSLRAELDESRKQKKGDKKADKVVFQFPALGDIIGAEKVKSAGIPDTIVQGKKQPNEEDKMKITEAYYDVLVKAVERAQFSYSPSQLNVAQLAVLYQKLSILIALKNGDECAAPETELRQLQNTLTSLIH